MSMKEEHERLLKELEIAEKNAEKVKKLVDNMEKKVNQYLKSDQEVKEGNRRSTD